MKRGKTALCAAGTLLACTLIGGTFLRDRLGDLGPLEGRLASWPRSAAVRSRDGATLSVTLSEDGEFCLPVLLSEMGRWLPLAVIETEDRRFYRHSGIDWMGLARAVRDNLQGTRTGASTVTSQIVRIAWPAERTFKTKLREFAQASALERRFGKERILEIYLNMIPLGSNIRGAEAAARAWFGRSARDLTIAQASLLAAMIKGPTAYRPDLHPAEARKRRDRIIRTLHSRGRITASQARSALAEPLPKAITPMPSSEWLFCQKVLSLHAEKDIRSTLDPAAQKILKTALLDALADQHETVTAAGVLIENSTGAVRAYVANARWGSGNTPGQWVDCASSLRSPGSALKPFAYAAAFEDGSVTPASLIADTPLTFSGRAPRNFDRLYRGPVSVGDALTDSLNVPTVRILRMVGGERLLQKLRLAGLDSLTREASYYGDSLVLGGCEVSPLRLAEASSALARLGKRVFARFAESDPFSEVQVFSPESAWLTSHVLADPARLPVLVRASGQSSFAFKTGTSYGLRDAWTVGWNERWTLAVWLGDPAGEPHPELMGLSAASPAVLRVFQSLEPKGGFEIVPPGIAFRKVCTLSGQPPASLCPRTVSAPFIAGISPSALCPMHRLEKGNVVVIWPQELSGYMNSSREKRTAIVIASPLEDADYLMHEKDARLVFRAEGTGTFSWFVDGRYVGRGTAELPCLWGMKPGKHFLSVIDSLGRQKSIRFSVSSLEGNAKEELPELEEIP